MVLSSVDFSRKDTQDAISLRLVCSVCSVFDSKSFPFTFRYCFEKQEKATALYRPIYLYEK